MDLGPDAPGWRVRPWVCPEGVPVVITGTPFFMGVAPQVCVNLGKTAGTV